MVRLTMRVSSLGPLVPNKGIETLIVGRNQKRVKQLNRVSVSVSEMVLEVQGCARRGGRCGVCGETPE